MVLFILAYLGGVLTILSPCIPVLPQSRAERRPGDTRQVGGNEGIGHDLKPVYLVLKGFAPFEARHHLLRDSFRSSSFNRSLSLWYNRCLLLVRVRHSIGLDPRLR